MPHIHRFAASAAIAATLAAVAWPAAAADCDPNALYLQIGDTQEPVIKSLGKKLVDSAVNPFRIVYITSGSCTNIDAMYSGTPINTNMLYIPSASDDPTWNDSKPSPTCTLPAPHTIDVANSNVFVSTCTSATTPTGLGLFQASIQGYVFVVPEASTEAAITAEEAYFVFGFGMQGQAEPWVDESFFFIRPPTKSTVQALAKNIGVDASRWKGIPLDKSGQVLTAVSTSASPAKTIGILGVEIYDSARDKINALAYRSFGQKYAYWPDKTANTFDKQNVRDGHYVPWSPTVYIAPTDGSGIIDDRARYLIHMLQTKTVSPAPDFNPLDIIISKGLVPDCAMKVTRQFDGGDLSLYTPAEPCGCHFESRVGQASAACVACADDNPCAHGVCRFGFCEAQ